MNSDQILVLGLVLGLLSLPSIVSAYSDGRPPRVAVIVILTAGCLVVWAFAKHPDGYTLHGMVKAVIHVVADIIR